MTIIIYQALLQRIILLTRTNHSCGERGRDRGMLVYSNVQITAGEGFDNMQALRVVNFFLKILYVRFTEHVHCISWFHLYQQRIAGILWALWKRHQYMLLSYVDKPCSVNNTSFVTMYRTSNFMQIIIMRNFLASASHESSDESLKAILVTSFILLLNNCVSVIWFCAQLLLHYMQTLRPPDLSFCLILSDIFNVLSW